MRCKKVAELLPAYVDGELPEKVARRVERHLATCARCEALLNVHQSTLAGWKNLAAYRPRRDLWPGIAAQIAATPSRPKVSWLSELRQPIWGLPAPAVGLAVFLVAVVVGLFAYRSARTPVEPVKPAVALSRTEQPAPDAAQDAPQIFQAVATVLNETRKPTRDRLLPVKAEVVGQAVLQLQSDPFLSKELQPLLDDVEIALTELSAAGSDPAPGTLQEVQKLIREKNLLVRLAVARSVLDALTSTEDVPPEVLAAYLQPPR